MERLKCNIEYIGIPGNVSNIAAFVKAVETDMKSGNPQYDLVGSYSSTAGTLAYNGYSADLLTLEHIDLDMPWWPSELIGTSTLNNHLYFATGDISTNLLYMMYATFYNKAYLNEFGLTDPNTLVSSGKWTLEEFEKMTKGIYSDVDGDGKKSDGDRYGYATYWLHLDCLFGSVGIKSVEKNSDDLLTVSDSYYSEKTQRMLERRLVLCRSERRCGKNAAEDILRGALALYDRACPRVQKCSCQHQYRLRNPARAEVRRISGKLHNHNGDAVLDVQHPRERLRSRCLGSTSRMPRFRGIQTRYAQAL